MIGVVSKSVVVSIATASVICTIHCSRSEPELQPLPRKLSAQKKPVRVPKTPLTLRLLGGKEGKWAKPEVVGAIKDVLRAWSRERVRCTNLQFTLEVAARTKDGARRNGVNELEFLDEEWCPSEARSKAECFDENEVAVTRTYLASTTGSEDHIVESDIRVNAVTQRWLDSGDALRRAISHELGHVLGLADVHVCSEQTSDLPSQVRRFPAGHSVMCPLESPEVPTASFWAPRAADRQFLCRVYPRQQ